ncbi:MULTISPECIES: NCS1 family transporter [Anaerotruncus]|uniref:NCS1 family transporter n=1 Tax=Anaerotruncus TaxID=244127 RepID=UPI001314CF6C|nr:MULTISPECIES: NCS1 family transporter [Anaerotruncus]
MSKQAEHKVDLTRVPDDRRLFGTVSYMLMWWSSVIVIQGFMLGQSMLPPVGGLNIFQALTAMVVASLTLAIFFSLNGSAGLKYGIPFAIHSRSSFGVKGSKIATLLRGVPALFWFGIATWIGADAIAMVTQTMFGFGNTMVYFFIFQILQVILAASGIQSIKWFESSMAIIIVLIMGYMMISISQNFGDQLTANWTSAGSWGMPFITSVVALVGAVFTSSVNNSDLTRYLKNSQKVNWIGHLAGIPISNAFLVGLGIMSGAAVGEWDPVKALVKIAPNTATAMLILIFIALAQITTNLTMNVLPPALTLMDFVPKIGWKTSCVIVGVLGVVTCPWLLFNSQGFFGLINAYSAFLGPVLGVMLADYFFIRKQTLDIDELYKENNTKYRFTNGWNLAALIAVGIGGIFGIIFNSLSWLVAMPIGLVVYMILYPIIYKSHDAKVKA